MYSTDDVEGHHLFFLSPITLMMGGDLTSIPVTRTFARGESIVLSQELIAANSGRDGVCSLLRDEEEQALHGGVRHVLDAWPDGLDVVERGSRQAQAEVDLQRAAAYQYLNGADLHRRLAEITAQYGYGSQAQVSKTMAHYADPDRRLHRPASGFQIGTTA